MTDSDDYLGKPLDRLFGPKTAAPLAKYLNLWTVGDLLHHYPRRYIDRGDLTPTDDLVEGEHVTVQAEIQSVSTRQMKTRRGSVIEVMVSDGGKKPFALTFFNLKYADRVFKVGRRGLFSGKVSKYGSGRWEKIQLVTPDYELFDAVEDRSVDDLGLIPVYPATAQTPSWTIAKCVQTALGTLEDLPEPLSAELRSRHRLIGLTEAVRTIHRPADRAALARARARLRWDEAFVLQIALAQRRAAVRSEPATPRRPVPDGLLAAFDRSLPFVLTQGQQEVGEVITADLGNPHPMHRLLQGEVGSGKTLVALRAMLAVVDAGGQAALLAPTEVLAQQHHRSLAALLGPLAMGGQLGGADRATRLALLTGSVGVPARRAAMLDAQSGAAGIVVGTHALLEDKVGFADLGLVVVDEQHRFGVEQRDALRAKGERPPHLLVMTATPIPRTVAMTVFGDLDVSTLTELPAGRAPITTHVVPVSEKPHFLERAWTRIREEVAAGHQAFVVCPRIGEAAGDDDTPPPDDEPDEAARRPPLAVLDVTPGLIEGPLAGLRVEMLHGRMAPDAKDEVMRAFAAGTVDVLVATTVIEVGVDVPNATVMAVLDADRFGISQLHQLRGRIGRGSAPGLCLLVTDSAEASPARERLAAVARTSDGFELSRLDLEARREGDVLGASQSGRRSSLRILSVISDGDVIKDAREEAVELVAADPTLASHPLLAEALRALLDPERAEFLEKA
jgi:ATP-dependent DNA helicase RecG